ncbi:MAG: hypothetical protein AAFX94_23450 [Myxococcota bacterium]
MIHVRFEGRSYDIESDALKLGVSANDRDIKFAVARHLDVRVERLHGYVIDRPGTGVVIVRPEAVYG